MRLICGVLHLDDADVGEDLLRAMAAQMDVPRLRPSLGLWRDGPVGLAVLDFSAPGAQARALPETAGLIMAADVRLDEPLALARGLGGAPEDEDALLLAMLVRSGPPGLNQVLGDFAFASWDRNTQCLVCGRDIFGVRPLAYVYQPGKLFAFASFPKALHGAGIVAKKIDNDAMVRRMVRNSRPDDSVIAGVKRLPPAHVIEVSRDGISLKRFWQFDRAPVGTRNCSPEEAARELRRLVDEAVKCRLPRSGEVGAHLSGGLDSSSIAVLAARRLREQGRSLHAYSFLDRKRNDISLEDETPFVKAVLEQEGAIDWTPILRPGGVAIGKLDADNMMPLDADAPENAACTRAEKKGVCLILSGWGGDEGATFNGRGALAEFFLRCRWRTLAREILALKRERGWSALRIFRGEVLSHTVPDPVKVLFRRAASKAPHLQASFSQTLSTAARRRGHQQLRMGPDARLNRWRLMTSPHISERAEDWAQTGARHGLAFAFPLLDRRVVEFALSLPSELFLRGGFRRRAFRDAMVDVLPDSVRLRHEKYQPFPSQVLDVAQAKNEFLTRIDVYSQNESVRRTIDIALLRRQVEAFPSPECLRQDMRRGNNPTLATMMANALRTLTAAEYLLQHGDQPQTR